MSGKKSCIFVCKKDRIGEIFFYESVREKTNLLRELGFINLD